MDLRQGLACSHMMMECPRCGFAQPKDRYCASCGLDVENFVAKPKPVFSRIVQSPNFHLTLIGILLLLVVGYIFYAQREVVQREMGNLFTGMPLRSKDAGDPNAKTMMAKLPSDTAAAAASDEIEIDTASPDPESPQATETAGIAPTAGSSEKSAEKTTEPQKIEISSWEMPREILSNLLLSAQKVGESNSGRTYLWTQGAKTITTVQTSGRRLSLSRTMPSQAGANAAIEAGTAPTDPFQFGLYLQTIKADSGDLQLKWDSTLVLPTPGALTESAQSGNVSITAGMAMLIIFEPPNRTTREEIISKAGDGPWMVLNSPHFRNGLTDWVVLIQLH